MKTYHLLNLPNAPKADEGQTIPAQQQCVAQHCFRELVHLRARLPSKEHECIHQPDKGSSA
jgi:hypothetical protein